MLTKDKQLHNLYLKTKECINCPLNRTDLHYMVPAYGNANSSLMIIGEAPGKNEEEQGIPFVGKSGKLITEIFKLLGNKKLNFFITNTVKCRPQNNRTPSKKEVAAYKNILIEEITIVKPKAICTLGSIATHALLEEQKKITDMRSKIHFFNNIPVIPTYHPAYILRNPQKKSFLMYDIKKAIEISKK